MVDMREIALRTAPLAASVLLHVGVYGTLGLAVMAPRAPAARNALLAELVVVEPSPAERTKPQPLDPPRRIAPPTTVTRAERPPAARRAVTESTASPAAASPGSPAPSPTVNAVEPPATTEVAPPAAGDHVTLSDVGPSSAVPAAPFDRYASATTPPSDRGGSSIAALPPGTLTGPAIPRGGYQVTPSYPASARRAGIEGTTLLGVRVEADGRVGDVVLKRSAGHPDLDRAAENAVRRWRFEPAHRGADAVAVWVDLPVQFHLR